MSKHSCTENKCRGQRFYGAKVKCTKCSEYTFIECLMQRAEIIELVKYLSFISQEKTNDQEKKNENIVRSYFSVELRMCEM